MSDWIDLQARATALYEPVLTAVSDWDAPTPCSAWTAREVLAHVVDEQLWVPGLLAGGTVEEVAGDLADRLRRLHAAPGPDLVADWESVREPVAAAWRGSVPAGAGEGHDDDDDTVVELSYGPAPARHYLAQQTFDLAVHAWDLAVSQGLDLQWGPELARAVREFVEADLSDNPAPELFDPPVPGYEGPDVPDRDAALALTGRDPGPWPARSALL